jgi:hypothetical protein
MPDPVIERYGTRYFPITFTGVDVQVDERGTHYHIKAVPVNEVAFGNPSVLKKPIKVGGSGGSTASASSVQGILENLVKAVTEQVQQMEEEVQGKGAQHDVYKIKFPTWDGMKWSDTPNDISKAKVTELTEDKNMFSMIDPSKNTTSNNSTGTNTSSGNRYAITSRDTDSKKPEQPKSTPYDPSSPTMQFNEGKSVQECIEAILKDSRFVRDKLEKMMGNQFNEVVHDNMVDYFSIAMEIKELKQIDKLKNKHYYEYTYVVKPYKIIYTKIPGFGNQTVDQKSLYNNCVRKYDYIYTGHNLDITHFKLEFNNLYFEAIPAGLGNPSGQQAQGITTKPDDTVARKLNNNNQSNSKGLPSAGIQVDPLQTDQQKNSGGQTQQSPYYAMAQAFHKAITDSKANMITGEIEILGDPIYLVTGGLGNNNPKSPPGAPRVSTEGEAQMQYADVLININFKNPIDILPDGSYQFDTKLVPFSGVYQVTTCKNNFKDGLFKQTLNIIRQPGQAIPVDRPDITPQSQLTPKTTPSTTSKEVPNSDNATTRDTSPASAADAGIRPDTMNLLDQLNRTLPSPGLPGVLSNFTDATGASGSTISIAPGINPNMPGLSRTISFLGQQNQPAFDQRLPTNAVVGLQQRVYSPGGYIQQMGVGLLNSFGISGPLGGAATQLANQYLSNVGRKINSIPVLGSGIGLGASINIVANNSNPTSNADYAANQLPTTPSVTPNIAGVSGNAMGYLANNLQAIPGITNNAALRAQSLFSGNLTDPLAVASAFGISAAQLSGLSPNISNNLIGALTSIAQTVPQNTDVNTAVKSGVNFNGLAKNDVAALPPTAPFTNAPTPAPDQGYMNKLASQGGLNNVAKSFGVNSIDQVSQTELPADSAQQSSGYFSTLLSRYETKLGLDNVNSPQDAAVAGLKIFAERQSLLGPTGILGSLEGNFIGVRNQLGPVNIVGNLGSTAPSIFGSKSASGSPLDNIMLR